MTLTACVGVTAGTSGTVVGAVCGHDAPSCIVVSGYTGNSAGASVVGGTISGGGQRGAPNQLSGDYGSVGGGEGNLAGEGSTVAGGSHNTAINFNAAVGGGSNNVASAQEAVVAGGLKNTASGRFAAVGGGAVNVASNINATVAGGSGNTARFTFAAVCGGTQNDASNVAAVVAGGDHNQADGAYSAILGGLNNNAAGYLTTIGGGAGNVATGSYSTIPGGFANSAQSDYSFAAGRRAEVAVGHPGTFLFADSNAMAFPSLAANEFAARATGGVRLVTAIDENGAQLSGVRLSPGSGSWETLSDYNSKSGSAAVDEKSILDGLMSIPVRSWNYKGENPAIRHLGPTAQDFHAAFHLGADDHYISTADADGIALASIQELYRVALSNGTAGTQARIDSLEERLALSNALAVVSCVVAVAALWKRSG